MIVLGISGRKQSGKTTVGNFILSLYLSKLNMSNKIFLDEEGQIIISDFGGDTQYKGAFKPDRIPPTDTKCIDLLDLLYSKVKIYSFADILKQDICMNILGLTYDQCYGTDEDKNKITHLQWDDKNISAREAMQIIGTDIFRKLDPNVWVKATIKRITTDKPEVAVITDCRFPNEIETIKNIDGKIIRLTRNPYNSDHTSERILDRDRFDWSKFDFVVDNTELSIYDQLSQIKNILDTILV